MLLFRLWESHILAIWESHILAMSAIEGGPADALLEFSNTIAPSQGNGTETCSSLEPHVPAQGWSPKRSSRQAIVSAGLLSHDVFIRSVVEAQSSSRQAIVF